MRSLLAAAALLLAGCGTPPVVAVKPGFDFSKVGRIAMIDPADYPGQAGSGAAVGEAMEPYLLKAGYNLVERSLVQQIMQEQSFSQSGAVDPATEEKLGKLLGVDALVIGQVTSAAEAQSSTYMDNTQSTSYQPVYQAVQYQDRRGNYRNSQQVAQYDVVTTNDQQPETYTTPATLSFSVRMVDVTTGTVLWTGSVSSQGDSLADAANKASGRLMTALKKAWPVQG